MKRRSGSRNCRMGVAVSRLPDSLMGDRSAGQAPQLFSDAVFTADRHRLSRDSGGIVEP